MCLTRKPFTAIMAIEIRPMLPFVALVIPPLALVSVNVCVAEFHLLDQSVCLVSVARIKFVMICSKEKIL